MACIYHQVGIRAPAEQVQRALTELDGLSGWWAPASGGGQRGDHLSFHFGEHEVRLKVLQSDDERVVWQNIAEDGEWSGTRFIFELKPAAGETRVNFRHDDWREITELFSHCSTKWAVFLLSLKDYLETGRGRPFPDDILIRHSDG